MTSGVMLRSRQKVDEVGQDSIMAGVVGGEGKGNWEGEVVTIKIQQRLHKKNQTDLISFLLMALREM